MVTKGEIESMTVVELKSYLEENHVDLRQVKPSAGRPRALKADYLTHALQLNANMEERVSPKYVDLVNPSFDSNHRAADIKQLKEIAKDRFISMTKVEIVQYLRSRGVPFDTRARKHELIEAAANAYIPEMLPDEKEENPESVEVVYKEEVQKPQLEDVKKSQLEDVKKSQLEDTPRRPVTRRQSLEASLRKQELETPQVISAPVSEPPSKENQEEQAKRKKQMLEIAKMVAVILALVLLVGVGIYLLSRARLITRISNASTAASSSMRRTTSALGNGMRQLHIQLTNFRRTKTRELVTLWNLFSTRFRQAYYRLFSSLQSVAGRTFKGARIPRSPPKPDPLTIPQEATV